MSIQRCKQTSGTLLMQYNIRILGMMPSGHQSCDEIATTNSQMTARVDFVTSLKYASLAIRQLLV